MFLSALYFESFFPYQMKLTGEWKN